MLPVDAKPNSANHAVGDSELHGQRLVGLVVGGNTTLNLHYLSFRELGKRMRGSLWALPAALLDHVLRVLLLGAGPEMLWVRAGRVVA